MSGKPTRRLQHQGEFKDREGKPSCTFEEDPLCEPLLAEHHSKEGYPEFNQNNPQVGNQKRKGSFSFTSVLSQFVNHCIRWIANIFASSGSLLGRLLHLQTSSTTLLNNKKILLSLNPRQEERLRILKQRLDIPFNGSYADHQDALKQLWKLAYPERKLPPLKSELWKEMGWQSADPSTDFRSAGFISLENLIFFAKNYPESFQRLLNKKDGRRSDFEYPFAAAGVNISFMLTQMLGLRSEMPAAEVECRFVDLIDIDEAAFDRLYCVAFQLLDSLWLSKCATYMEFNEVLKSTRAQLEHELTAARASSVGDLPAYQLLNRKLCCL
ncbi:hypothetical protein HPP92_018001 [Vanilla planifolia]|uniref:ELMO domain-containing protein n=1 Tax=Vanilla planifolia TaxID=51239 RepID=A0A835UP05_VANPL|nr:hypothetical protein HPP92_018001 [Vanilla planifolia]